MKTLVVLFFCTIYVFACGVGSFNPEVKRLSQLAVSSPTPDFRGCVEENYRHKSEAELAAMTPHQLVDEYIKEQLYHRPVSDDLYTGEKINKYIRKAGANILPVLTEYINGFIPENESECEVERFFVSVTMADSLDFSVIRLRGTKDGRSAIEALERAVERVKAADFGTGEDRTESYLSFALRHLASQKGITFADESIRDTFWVRRKIEMSDQELLDFTNFLIERDPTYPGWSGKEYLKDYTRTNEAGNPKQVWILTKPERFYKAYDEFKAGKSK